MEQLLQAKARGITVDDGATFYEAIAGRVDLSSLRPSVLLFSDGFQVSALMLVIKRAVSVLGSIIGLTVTLPVMALIAALIRLESNGPAIFRQKRIGQDGRPFTLYKFRSMYECADLEGHVRAAEAGDSRCTRVGKWLRRSRLDELPQFFNILRGDMDFIGPRPFAADMEAELADKIPYYSKRWAVKPGATGWAQVRKGYNETLEDNIEKLGYDLYYIKNVSVGLDFLILLETLKILLLGRGGR
jgi:lipopolysaccharide/colanic/teichoic acid biosynthesis glycosyltransferase